VSDILSQEEIEALLSSLSSDDSLDDPQEDHSVRGGGHEAPAHASYGGYLPASKPGSKGPISYEVYDFRRPDKFSKEQLRTLQMLHETFARTAATSLSAYLRSPLSIDLVSLEQVPYEEYLRSLNRSVFSIIALNPLSGEAALEMEFDLIFVMVDKLLGGPGRTLTRSNLTDIETPLVRQIVDRILQSLKLSWEGVVIVNPSIDGIETSAQFVQIAPPSDIVVSILFELRVGDIRGAMSLCIPYMLLKPITNKLSAQKWFMSSGSRRQSPMVRSSLTALISEASVPCEMELGDSSITIRDFLSLRPGDVVKLRQKSNNPAVLKVAGIPKLVGKPVLDGKKLVLQILGYAE
jgi:flagellar motor switch protein FliM